MKVFMRRDFVAGLMFALFGLCVVLVALQYRMGVLSSMGPGFFPFWLGILLTFFGSVIIVSDIRAGDAGEKTARFDLKALGLVLFAILVFAFVLRPVGLYGCIALTVLICSFASHEFRWIASIVNALVLAALCVAIFVYGIGLYLPIWPSFVTRWIDGTG